MDLDFNEIAVFAGDELVQVTVSMKDNETTVEGYVYIRRLPSVEIDRFVSESNDASIDVRVNAVPRLLSKAVRKVDGKLHFTAEKAGSLTNFNRTALMNAVMKVNHKVNSEELGND